MAETLPSRERPAWVEEELGGATGRGVRVAVVDSGCDGAWRDERILEGLALAEREEPWKVRRGPDTEDGLGHGTACADIILGLAPGVEILPLRVFGDRLETSPEVLVAALEAALELGARVVNLSLGTHREDAQELLSWAAQKARDCGLILVSAVPRGRGWILPGTLPTVLGVEAGRFANVHDFEFRPEHPANCRAQGTRQVRWLAGSRRTTSGASVATPHIAAIVALFLEQDPSLTPQGVEELLSRFAQPLADEGGGRPPCGGMAKAIE